MEKEQQQNDRRRVNKQLQKQRQSRKVLLNSLRTEDTIQSEKKQSNTIENESKNEQGNKNPNELSDLELYISLEPTSVLFITNCGAKSGFNATQINSIFSGVPGFVHSVVPHNKPFSCVVFDSTDSAKQAFNQLNFKDDIPSLKNRLLLLDFASTTFINSSSNLLESQNSSLDQHKNQDSHFPPGLFLRSEFITSEEESLLLSQINEFEWHELTKRKVQHYGYAFNYTTRNVDPSQYLGPFPAFLQFLILKFQQLFSSDPKLSIHFSNYTPDQLTINSYEPGQGIPPHVDTHSAFEDCIISLSLEGETVMDFIHPNGHHLPFSVSHVSLPQRSLLIMTGESRFEWAHGITPRKTDQIGNQSIKRTRRVSLTFRKVRKNLSCSSNCPWPAQCDTARNQQTSNKSSSNLEEKHVHKVYDLIAENFAETRQKPWPRIIQFLNNKQDQEHTSTNNNNNNNNNNNDSGVKNDYKLVLDVGCGSGRYLEANCDELYKIGTDRSLPLVRICKEANNKNVSVLRSDNLFLPFRNDIFDLVLSIAVIHHFSNEEHREQAVKELVRVLRVGGKVMIYVWAMEQDKNEKRRFGQQDVFVSWKLPKKSENNNNNNNSEEKDKDLKENGEGETYQRFYHVFRQGELEELLVRLKNVKIVESYYDRENWVVIAEKTAMK